MEPQSRVRAFALAVATTVITALWVLPLGALSAPPSEIPDYLPSKLAMPLNHIAVSHRLGKGKF